MEITKYVEYQICAKMIREISAEISFSHIIYARNSSILILLALFINLAQNCTTLAQKLEQFAKKSGQNLVPL